jgi:hypothetical protein
MGVFKQFVIWSLKYLYIFALSLEFKDVLCLLAFITYKKHNVEDYWGPYNKQERQTINEALKEAMEAMERWTCSLKEASKSWNISCLSY